MNFLIALGIVTPSNIFDLPPDLCYFSPSFLEFLEKNSFFDNNPFFDEKRYFKYCSSFQPYLVLFFAEQSLCTAQICGKHDNGKDILNPLDPNFSEKFLRLIEVAKKGKPKDWISFFGLMQLIIAEDNYKDLSVTLQQKVSFADESDILLLLES